jgi:hypothetical protein
MIFVKYVTRQMHGEYVGRACNSDESLIDAPGASRDYRWRLPAAG